MVSLQEEKRGYGGKDLQKMNVLSRNERMRGDGILIIIISMNVSSIIRSPRKDMQQKKFLSRAHKIAYVSSCGIPLMRVVYQVVGFGWRMISEG